MENTNANLNCSVKGKWRVTLLVFFSLLILAGALRFYKLGEWSYDIDEPYTLLETHSFINREPPPDFLLIPKGLSRQIEYLPRLICAAHCVHWLNYKLIGDDDFSSRVFPAAIGTFTVGIVFLLTKPLFGFPTALILAMLICLNPEHIFHSQNNRFYAQVFFFISLVFLLGGHIAKRKSLAAAICIGPAAVLMVLSHSLGGVIWGVLLCGLFAEWVITSGKRYFPFSENTLSTDESGNWRLPLIFIVLWSIVLLAIAWFHIKPLAAGWNNSAVWLTPKEAVWELVLNNIGIPFFIFALLTLSLFFSVQHNNRNIYWMCCFVCLLFAVVLLPLMITYNWRYGFLFSFPAYVCAAVFIGWIFQRMTETKIRFARIIAVVSVWMFLGLYIPSLPAYYQSGNRRMMREAVQYVSEHWREGDKAALHRLNNAVFHRYFHRQPPVMIDFDPVAADSFNNVKTEVDNGNRIWIILETSLVGGLPDDARLWLSQNAVFEKSFFREKLAYAQKGTVVEVYHFPR